MTTQHTSGPWIVYDDSNDGKTNRIEIAARGKTVAHIYHSVPEKDLPNARLIAAAPDLLEALKRVMPFIDCIAAVTREEIIEYEAAMKMADAAIKKATGQE